MQPSASILVPALRGFKRPRLEGALAAAVQARLGGSLEQVIAEARGSLAAKRHLILTTMSEEVPVRVGRG